MRLDLHFVWHVVCATSVNMSNHRTADLVTVRTLARRAWAPTSINLAWPGAAYNSVACGGGLEVRSNVRSNVPAAIVPPIECSIECPIGDRKIDRKFDRMSHRKFDRIFSADRWLTTRSRPPTERRTAIRYHRATRDEACHCFRSRIPSINEKSLDEQSQEPRDGEEQEPETTRQGPGTMSWAHGLQGARTGHARSIEWRRVAGTMRSASPEPGPRVLSLGRELRRRSQMIGSGPTTAIFQRARPMARQWGCSSTVAIPHGAKFDRSGAGR